MNEKETIISRLVIEFPRDEQKERVIELYKRGYDIKRSGPKVIGDGMEMSNEINLIEAEKVLRYTDSKNKEPKLLTWFIRSVWVMFIATMLLVGFLNRNVNWFQ